MKVVLALAVLGLGVYLIHQAFAAPCDVGPATVTAGGQATQVDIVQSPLLAKLLCLSGQETPFLYITIGTIALGVGAHKLFTEAVT